jgi:hypothetical protein
VLAVAIAVIGLRPPGSKHEQAPSIPAVAMPAVASPTANAGDTPASVVASASPVNTGCDQQPSSLNRLDLTGPTSYEDAIQLPDAATEGRAGAPAELLPTGAPASDQQVAEVTETVQQLIDCVADGNAEKLSSLFSDDYWRRMNFMGLDYNASNAYAYAPLVRPSSDRVPPMPLIDDVIVLPDGRLAAALIPSFGRQSREAFDYYVFVESNGVLLIDEAVHSSDRPELDLTVNDEGFSDTTLLVTSGKTDLVLTNTGTVTHSIVIPELNIRIEVEPGASGTATIVYEEATVDFSSDMPTDTAPAFSGTLTIDFPDDIATPVAVTPEPVNATCDVSPASDSKLASTGNTAFADALARPEDAEPGTISAIDASGIPLGSYANTADSAAISDTMARLASCFNNGTPLQVAGFFTDDYFRRLSTAGVNADDSDAQSFAPFQLNSNGAVPSVPSVTDVIVLPDGRVGARIQVRENGWNNLQYEFYVFANVDGHWLVDEAVFVGRMQNVTIEITDEGFVPARLNWTMDPVRFTVKNSGTREHSFVEPESGLTFTVEPGDSQTVTFIPGASGTFTFTSESPGDTGPGFTGSLVISEQ